MSIHKPINVAVWTKAAEHPGALTSAEIDELDAQGGPSVKAWATARRDAAIPKAANTPRPLTTADLPEIVNGVERGIRHACDPLHARIKALEADNRALSDRVLVVEAGAAARVER